MAARAPPHRGNLLTRLLFSASLTSTTYAYLLPLDLYNTQPPPRPPNYVDPPSIGPLIIAANAILLAFSFIAVILRLYSRRTISNALHLEDYLIVLGWILCFTVSFSIAWMTRHGLGRHIYDIPFEDIFGGKPIIADYILTVFFMPSVVCVKCSILIFYLRLESNLSPSFRIPCIITIVVTIASGAIITFLFAFGCSPVAALWNFQLQLPPAMGGVGAKCLSTADISTSGAVTNMVLDIIIWTLPFKIVFRLQMSLRKKLQVGIVFGLGIFACLCSILRLVLMIPAHHAGDWSWDGGILAVITATELNVGIVCACLPAVKKLASKHFPAWFGRMPGRIKGGTSGGGTEESGESGGVVGVGITTIGGTSGRKGAKRSTLGSERGKKGRGRAGKYVRTEDDAEEGSIGPANEANSMHMSGKQQGASVRGVRKISIEDPDQMNTAIAPDPEYDDLELDHNHHHHKNSVTNGMEPDLTDLPGSSTSRPYRYSAGGGPGRNSGIGKLDFDRTNTVGDVKGCDRWSSRAHDAAADTLDRPCTGATETALSQHEGSEGLKYEVYAASSSPGGGNYHGGSVSEERIISETFIEELELKELRKSRRPTLD